MNARRGQKTPRVSTKGRGWPWKFGLFWLCLTIWYFHCFWYDTPGTSDKPMWGKVERFDPDSDPDSDDSDSESPDVEAQSDKLSKLSISTVSVSDPPAKSVSAGPEKACPFLIPVYVHNKPVTMLTDSGAEAACIRHTVVRDLGLASAIQDCLPIEICTATAHYSKISQSISLPLQIGSWNGHVTFYVVDNLSQEAILGLPFVQAHNRFIDWTTLKFAEVSAVKRIKDSTSIHLCPLFLIPSCCKPFVHHKRKLVLSTSFLTSNRRLRPTLLWTPSLKNSLMSLRKNHQQLFHHWRMWPTRFTSYLDAIFRLAHRTDLLCTSMRHWRKKLNHCWIKASSSHQLRLIPLRFCLSRRRTDLCVYVLTTSRSIKPQSRTSSHFRWLTTYFLVLETANISADWIWCLLTTKLGLTQTMNRKQHSALVGGVVNGK